MAEAPNYIVAGDMSADVTGAAIPVGAKGDLLAVISWANTGTAIGTLSLQWLGLDGVTWRDVPGASAEFTANGNAQPNNSTATIVCYWRELRVYQTVRLKYTRGSGGSANTSLTARVTSI